MMRHDELAFEDVLSEDWSRDLDVVEVPLGERPMRTLALAVILVASLIFFRVIWLTFGSSGIYNARAFSNLNKVTTTLPPRGLIVDRFGAVLAENRATFSLFLDTKEFLKNPELQSPTLEAIQRILGLTPEEVWNVIQEQNVKLDNFTDPVALATDLSQSQIVAVEGMHLSTLLLEHSFERLYPKGSPFASLIGYTGLLTAQDLETHKELTGADVIGKAGLELTYDDTLRGTPGRAVEFRDAKGKIIGEGATTDPAIGATLSTTIDAEFQSYFYDRMVSALRSLGRTTGAAIAMNPQNGEILSLLSFPSFDNNLFVKSGSNKEKKTILSSPLKPLFNRAVGGVYNPGSTIKPLVGIAALKEGVITPDTTVFSPGYLDIPNPYDALHPTRYLDWRYQGYVNLASAIAQSSDVYFYEVAGGFGDIKGLGISRLSEWWKKFHFGAVTGLDMPGEAKGFLPTPAWKESHNRGAWLLGDTFNVSIGQGDFSVTPIQLLDYISTIANGGVMYLPHLNLHASPKVMDTFTDLTPEIKEVEKGMIQTVTSKLGTAYLLNDLPFPIAAKTGSAQVENNTKENAFFVGYTPVNPATGQPQIAILILIEHSKEGSLNAVPIAKDVFNWYYEHRIHSSNTSNSK